MIITVDDTCEENWRLNEMLLNYNVDVVWFLDFRDEKMATDQINTFQAFKNYEIGNHTINHPLLTRIPLEEAKQEIDKASQKITDLAGYPPYWFNPPRGYTNDELNKHILSTGHGLIRLTTVDGNNDGDIMGKVIHIYDRSEYGTMKWREWADKNMDDDSIIMLHAWELTKFDMWEEFEQFLKDYS